MKRLHVHVAVHDLQQSIRFYSALFAAEPAVKKDDYAKWMLDDPRVNFAISARGAAPGLNHLGVQVENADGTPGVETILREYRGQYYLFVVNCRAEAQRARFRLELLLQ